MWPTSQNWRRGARRSALDGSVSEPYRPPPVRRRIAKLGATVVVAAIVADGGSTPPAPGSFEIAQTTMVRGTGPNLEGRWLLATSLGTGGGRRSTASLWEVTRVAGQVVLTERFVKLPDDDRSARPDGWEPTPAEVETIAAGWETLPSEQRGIARVSHEIIGRDAFDAAAKTDALATDALWIVRQNVGFAPEPSRPAKEIRVFAARLEDADGYRGKCITTMIVATPMPMPIEVQGTFRLVRVPLPSRPFWRRLLDVFR
jgi:hypothetical protein